MYKGNWLILLIILGTMILLKILNTFIIFKNKYELHVPLSFN